MSCNREWLSSTQCSNMFCIVGVYMFVSAYHIQQVQNFGVEVMKTYFLCKKRD